ncbi:hypothetical protein KI387_003381, partial [Taxus chinensis]
YGVAIVPEGFQTSEDEVDKVYNNTDGDNWPFPAIDRSKAPQTIEERVKETMRRTERWCRMNGLIYLGVDFTTSPLGNAPPRSKKQLKGKAAEGEPSTVQEEAPESPPSSEPEQ